MNNCRRAEEYRSVGLCRPVGDAAAIIIIIIIIMSMQRQPLSMMPLMMMTKEDTINNS